MIHEGDCGAIGGIKIGRGNRSTRRKPAPAPFCPPQIPLDKTRARTRAAAVGSPKITHKANCPEATVALLCACRLDADRKHFLLPFFWILGNVEQIILRARSGTSITLIKRIWTGVSTRSVDFGTETTYKAKNVSKKSAPLGLLTPSGCLLPYRFQFIIHSYAANRKVAGSIPDEVIGFFNWPNPYSRTAALGWAQPLTEMSTRNLPGVKPHRHLWADWLEHVGALTSNNRMDLHGLLQG
jgi:hypothetical protein